MRPSTSKFRASELHIRSVGPEDAEQLTAFTCGNAELDAFLREDTVARESEGLLRTYLAFQSATLVGYVSLLADTLKLDPEKDNSEVTTKYPVPGVKVARLGVSATAQRGGVGTLLMNFALSKLHDISDHVGCRFLIVDAKIETKADEFYARLGFERNMSKDYVKRKKAISMRFDPFAPSSPAWVDDDGNVISQPTPPTTA